MKFPGSRKTKHYFPVSESSRIPLDSSLIDVEKSYIVGLDQLLVDIEVHVSDEFLTSHSIKKGESQVFDDQFVDDLYSKLKTEGRIVGEFAGVLSVIHFIIIQYCRMALQLLLEQSLKISELVITLLSISARPLQRLILVS